MDLFMLQDSFSGFDADFDGFTITNPDWDVDCQPMGI